jgi:nucleoside-diphosphate-sugar epimerase
MARWLIVGCGYVGGVLAEQAVAAGDAVWGLRRSEAAVPAGVQPLVVDVSVPVPPEVVPSDLDGVVYAVAAKARDEAAYRSAYVDGLRHVLDALSASNDGRPRVVFTSSTAVYGQVDGEWVDETSPTDPPRFNGRLLLEAEALLAEASLPGSSLRLGGIYGPGRTSRLRSVAEGRTRVREGPPHYTNRIHRDDAAGAALHLLRMADPPPVVLGVDDDPVDEATLADGMAEMLGRPAPPRVPAGDATPPRGGSKRCRNALLRSLGYELVYPTWREGYRALLPEVDDASPGEAGV